MVRVSFIKLNPSRLYAAEAIGRIRAVFWFDAYFELVLAGYLKPDQYNSRITEEAHRFKGRGCPDFY
jgi:hypothetical protein